MFRKVRFTGRHAVEQEFFDRVAKGGDGVGSHIWYLDLRPEKWELVARRIPGNILKSWKRLSNLRSIV